MIKLNTEVCRIMFSKPYLELSVKNASEVLGLIDERPTFLIYREYIIPRLMVLNNTVVRKVPSEKGVGLSEESLLHYNLI